MGLHNIKPVVGGDVPLDREGKVEMATTERPHTYTIVITIQIESGFITENDLVLFGCTRHLALIRTDTEARIEGSACVWMVENEAVDVLLAYRMKIRPVEGIVSLIAMSLLPNGPNTSSQSQNDQGVELLA
ncbi:hypothetical protein TNCV_3994321 [Trichonephila clavipes]|uniref:Uncharacterized protein n=1 Tax=Trichonephila clavipes TaxID=2585209 RepID=A0A8X6T172_TRICX|nr:hypothetical protein TNCV_3994321 [Trichonephila clavipes]